MGHPVDGQTHDDDDPTRADVNVRLPELDGSPVRAYEDAVGEAVETEIKNKIVEAVAAWAQDFNERNNVVGRRGSRHCKDIIIDPDVIIEE